jgi:hypothetical protein
MDLGMKLFEAANDPKEFCLEHGSDHNDALSPECFAAIERFVLRADDTP